MLETILSPTKESTTTDILNLFTKKSQNISDEMGKLLKFWDKYIFKSDNFPEWKSMQSKENVIFRLFCLYIVWRQRASSFEKETLGQLFTQQMYEFLFKKIEHFFLDLSGNLFIENSNHKRSRAQSSILLLQPQF